MAPASSDGKAVLRSRVRAARREWRDSVDDAAVLARATALAEIVLARPDVATACATGRVVTCYASGRTEPPTDVLLERLRSWGARVLLPVVGPQRSLAWVEYGGPEALREGPLGIREPVGEPVADSPGQLLALEPAVLLVPALAVDASRARLGQGGGYYDTLLAAVPTDGPVIVALIGPEGDLPAGTVPTAAHDRPVHDRVIG